MDALKKQRLTAAGIDLDGALERFMGNEALLERFLKRFLQDENEALLSAALTGGDLESALTASHTLKGVCGNLSMDVLFELFGRQVALLRQEEWDKAAAMMPEIEKVYAETLAAIEECGL